ncbi:BNR repeat domain protein [Ectocarpus siliculosus]|uniref:BNR repeat domain protein n=1 Tax=Ectocarpus siliculosus TaxID=2880 RepID=D7G6L9_ECTSI|nr:BNR repeat domain protein [Ectocarpus siliculosus]|eukprot:CBJ33958.1 BNR repeat domain protein [Ectocarpus siliculosus]
MQRRKKKAKEPKDDGRVVNAFTWGTGDGGQLGYGLDIPIAQNVPRPAFPIGALAGRHVVRAAAGGRHSLFLLECGEVLACGVWDDGQLGCMDRPVVLVPGSTEEMVSVPKSLVPRGSETFPVPVQVPPKLIVKELAAGFASSFLVTDFGEVWSWGSGKFGCLGLGDDESRWFPSRIPLFAENQPATAETVSAGKWHVLCLTQKTHEVYAWGRNNWGQLGTGEAGECERSPVAIRWTKRETPLKISAGADHSVAMVDLLRPNQRRDIVAYAWGNPDHGRLGSERQQTHASPMEVEDLTHALRKLKRTIAGVSAGGTHTLAVLGSGEVAAWGGGMYGQLGDGHMWDRPESVMATGLQGVRSVSAGARHSTALAVDMAGTQVWGWGFNRWGELGGGDESVRLQPYRVGGLDGCTVQHVVAGERHTIALTNGKALRVKDLGDYRGFINAYKKGGLMVYDALKKTMEKQKLNPDWLDTPLEFFPGQPGMTSAECRLGTAEPHMDWCMDTAPPGKDVFDSLRGGHEIVYVCRPCKRDRVCLACARKCHSKHCIEPAFRLRDGSKPCDCSTTPGMCACKWSPMREHFRAMTASGVTPGNPALGDDGLLHPSELRELLQIVRGGAAFVTSDDVDEGLALLTQGGEKERIGYLPFERWYEEHFSKIDAELDEGGGT